MFDRQKIHLKKCIEQIPVQGRARSRKVKPEPRKETRSEEDVRGMGAQGRARSNSGRARKVNSKEGVDAQGPRKECAQGRARSNSGRAR
jgi:hypothetical protein